MRNKTLTLRGLKTPRLFLFIHGFMNGRFKTADIDQESLLLSSAYINGMTCLFNEFCQKRVAKLETDLSAIRMEAESLLLELRALPGPEREVDSAGIPEVPAKLPETIAEAQCFRAAARTAAQAMELSKCSQKRRDEIAAKRADTIGRLAEIHRRIATKEQICCQELGAVVDALRERFCVYGHGVLLKPIRTRYIPNMEYARYLDSYYACHNTLKREIAAVLRPQKEEE